MFIADSQTIVRCAACSRLTAPFGVLQPMVYNRIIATVALALFILLLPDFAGAETGAGGFQYHREFGALTVEGFVDEERARVTVKLAIRGEFVGESVLTPNSPEYRFAVNVGQDSACGVVRLRMVAPPQQSVVDASIGCTPKSFTGSLVSWVAAENIIYSEQQFPLTPDLSAITTVRGAARTNVTVTLMAGSIAMYTLSVVQASPNAVITDSLVLGDIRIAPGASFALTIPTPLQQGQMIMSAQFQSRNIPPTKFAAAIAIWQ